MLSSIPLEIHYSSSRLPISHLTSCHLSMSTQIRTSNPNAMLTQTNAMHAHVCINLIKHVMYATPREMQDKLVWKTS